MTDLFDLLSNDGHAKDYDPPPADDSDYQDADGSGDLDDDELSGYGRGDE